MRLVTDATCASSLMQLASQEAQGRRALPFGRTSSSEAIAWWSKPAGDGCLPEYQHAMELMCIHPGGPHARRGRMTVAPALLLGSLAHPCVDFAPHYFLQKQFGVRIHTAQYIYTMTYNSECRHHVLERPRRGTVTPRVACGSRAPDGHL